MDNLSKEELEAHGILGQGLSSPKYPGVSCGLWTKDAFTGPMTSDVNIRELKEILDRLLLRQTELSQSNINVTAAAEKMQKTGYLHLAKARYVQGPQVASKDRLPTENSEEAEALSTVKIRKMDIRCPIDQTFIRFPHRELVSNNKAAAQAKLLQGLAGALPPTSIKEAQKCFRRALELHLERANIREEMAVTEKKYKSSMNLLKAMVKTKTTTIEALALATPIPPELL